MSWPVVDHLGTVRDLVKQDAAVATHFVYDAFGAIVSGDTSLTRYLFTSREYDAQTALQYNRARWYDPSTGRWISEDPLGFAAGDVNTVRYVGNAVTGSRDPSGLEGGPMLILDVGDTGLHNPRDRSADDEDDESPWYNLGRVLDFVLGSWARDLKKDFRENKNRLNPEDVFNYRTAGGGFRISPGTKELIITLAEADVHWLASGPDLAIGA